MGTRSTTHFISEGETCAIVYRHWDGYPKGAGVDLCKFITRCKKLTDHRLNDPNYLAARYVVFLGEIFAADDMFKDPKGNLHKHIPVGVTDKDNWKYVKVPRKDRLNFLSVGIMMSDPLDIEYRYTVDCGKIVNGRPEVKCFKVNIGDDGKDTYCVEVTIPGRTKVTPVVESWDLLATIPSRTHRNGSAVLVPGL